MTFICEPDSYSLKIYHMCKNELPMSRLSKVYVKQTELRLYTTPLHGWSKRPCKVLILTTCDQAVTLTFDLKI